MQIDMGDLMVEKYRLPLCSLYMRVFGFECDRNRLQRLSGGYPFSNVQIPSSYIPITLKDETFF